MATLTEMQKEINNVWSLALEHEAAIDKQHDVLSRLIEIRGELDHIKTTIAVHEAEIRVAGLDGKNDREREAHFLLACEADEILVALYRQQQHYVRVRAEAERDLRIVEERIRLYGRLLRVIEYGNGQL